MHSNVSSLQRRLKKKKRLSAAIVRESSDEEDSESDEEKLHIDVKNDNKEVSFVLFDIVFVCIFRYENCC